MVYSQLWLIMNNISLHALKTLSCFTAVSFYSTRYVCDVECFLHGNTVSTLYFLSMIAKPLFFIIIGYIDEEQKITKKYIFLKIKSIVLIVVFWNVLFLFMNSELFKRGYLLQNGVLLSIAAIYIFYPLIIRILRHWAAVVLVMILFALSSMLLQLFAGHWQGQYIVNISDYYGVFISIAFYLFGRMLGGVRGRELSQHPRMLWSARVGIIPAAVLLVIYERYVNHHLSGVALPWYILEPVIISILCLLLFVLFDNLTIRNGMFIKIVTFISPTMVGVYIMHYSLFYLFFTAYDFDNVTLSFTVLLGVFMASVIVSRLLLLNKYTSQVISL